MITRGRQSPAELETRNVPPDGRPLEEQPRWRKDFPIEWPEDEAVSRRELVKFIVLTSAAFSVGQLWIVVKSMIRPAEPSRALPVERIASVDELPVGGARVAVREDPLVMQAAVLAEVCGGSIASVDGADSSLGEQSLCEVRSVVRAAEAPRLYRLDTARGLAP